LNNLKVNISNKFELKEALNVYQNLILKIYPFHIYHESGVIIDANTEFQEVTGLIINPLSKRTLFEIFDPAKRTEYLRYLQNNASDFFEVKIKDKSGNLIRFDALNIVFEYNNSMVKLLALKNPFQV